MCLAHDLAESIVGDITPSDGISKEEKFAKEKVYTVIDLILYKNVVKDITEVIPLGGIGI